VRELGTTSLDYLKLAKGLRRHNGYSANYQVCVTYIYLATIHCTPTPKESLTNRVNVEHDPSSVARPVVASPKSSDPNSAACLAYVALPKLLVSSWNRLFSGRHAEYSVYSVSIEVSSLV